jgi:hypothetical protein
MEIIKKTIKQAVTTGTTENSTGNTFIIVPDLNAKYHMKVLLTAKKIDLGVFDTYEYPYGYDENSENILGIGEDLLMDNNFI